MTILKQAQDIAASIVDDYKNNKLRWGLIFIAAIIFISVPVLAVLFAPAPTITLASPKNNEVFQDRRIKVAGRVEPTSSLLYFNDKEVEVDSNGEFEIMIGIKEGPNRFKLSAINGTEVTEISRTVISTMSDEKYSAKVAAEKKAEKQQAATKAEAEKRKAEVEEEASKDLDLTLNYGWGGVKLVNNEAKDWENCDLELNSGLFGGGYKATWGIIPANDETIIGWSSFTEGDGTRFNFAETAPKTINIHCTVDGNRRHANLGT